MSGRGTAPPRQLSSRGCTQHPNFSNYSEAHGPLYRSSAERAALPRGVAVTRRGSIFLFYFKAPPPRRVSLVHSELVGQVVKRQHIDVTTPPNMAAYAKYAPIFAKPDDKEFLTDIGCRVYVPMHRIIRGPAKQRTPSFIQTRHLLD